MKIAIGSDHGGYALKEAIVKYLKKKRMPFRDFGTFSLAPVDYPDIAKAVAKAVSAKKFKFGILICGTGLGMSMVANKVRGIRAAVCHDLFTTEMARRHNDANILVMGGRVLKSGLALRMVNKFLTTEFEGGRHLRRVKKIEA